MRTMPVEVHILHPAPAAAAGPLERSVGVARAELAERHRVGFLSAGAAAVRVVTGATDDGRSFGERLRALIADVRADHGIVVLGSGAVPLATRADRAAFVAAAGADHPGALANNRYSADVVAVACAGTTLRELPDLATDNALPRWLVDAGVPVTDLRSRWRLGIDIDGPLDLVLLGGAWADPLPPATTDVVSDRLARVRALVADPRAEIVVAGRTSAATLRWLERAGAARTRALIEERGMRTSAPGQRPPASVLGALLDRDGPGSLGSHLARLGDAAVIDSRVLLAHRHGAEPRTWPSAEDRFASDLLLPARIADPWLRELTSAALDGPIPIVLGGHTLVGPGLRLALRQPRGADRHG